MREERGEGDDGHSAGHYEIRLRGHLSARWADWFDGLELIHEAGNTVISGPVVDQAALHGLLATIRDLGLPLISVKQVNSDSTNDKHA